MAAKSVEAPKIKAKYRSFIGVHEILKHISMKAKLKTIAVSLVIELPFKMKRGKQTRMINPNGPNQECSVCSHWTRNS